MLRRAFVKNWAWLRYSQVARSTSRPAGTAPRRQATAPFPLIKTKCALRQTEKEFVLQRRPSSYHFHRRSVCSTPPGTLRSPPSRSESPDVEKSVKTTSFLQHILLPLFTQKQILVNALPTINSELGLDPTESWHFRKTEIKTDFEALQGPRASYYTPHRNRLSASTPLEVFCTPGPQEQWPPYHNDPDSSTSQPINKASQH